MSKVEKEEIIEMINALEEMACEHALSHGQLAVKEYIPKIIGVLEKSIPQKPIGLSISHEGMLGNCPNCNKLVWAVSDIHYHANRNCLQELDWSQDE